MLPFHGTISAIFGAFTQSFFFYKCLLPSSYYIEKPELAKEYIVFAGSFGITIGTFIVPMLTYWIGKETHPPGSHYLSLSPLTLILPFLSPPPLPFPL